MFAQRWIAPLHVRTRGGIVMTREVAFALGRARSNELRRAQTEILKEEILRLSKEGHKTPAICRMVGRRECRVMKLRKQLREEGRL